ncbi:hypothetical protein [Agrobacterium pusense]|nr:hypothetical protein [Agrobacterium pusense]MDH0869799.1 hypothetical protein [Agrobacterium pusense]
MADYRLLVPPSACSALPAATTGEVAKEAMGKMKQIAKLTEES